MAVDALSELIVVLLTCWLPTPGWEPLTTHAELDADEVARVVGVNVIGVANCVAAVVPGMVARGRGPTGRHLQSGCIQRIAEVSGVLRQQGGGLSLF